MSEQNPLASAFDPLTPPDSKRQIVKELLDSEENIALKTEINNVGAYAVLETLANAIEIEQLSKSSETLAFHTNQLYRLNLSKDRQSRKEYIESLKALNGGVIPTE